MKAQSIVVATHGHCFDGMASATLFTYLIQALRSSGSVAFRYKSCGYSPGMTSIPPSWLDGDENAILDFRYTRSKKLTWYFDHHVTAFDSPAQHAKAIARAADTASHVYYDAAYGSCAKLIADVCRDRFGVDPAPLQQLIDWADIIDTARFPSAEAAVSRIDPVMQLASVIEHHGDSSFLEKVVPWLLERPVSEVACMPEIQELWRPVADVHQSFAARIQQSATMIGHVVFVDLSDIALEAVAKFVTYALFPLSVYSVTLSRHRHYYKLSIGYNPWCGQRRTHDIASICKRYDGGGHLVVGAASFPLSALDRAREAARAVTQELNGDRGMGNRE